MDKELQMLNNKLSNVIKFTCNQVGCKDCRLINYDAAGKEISCEATILQDMIYKKEFK